LTARRTARAAHKVHRSVFDVYSEALVCRLLRERGKGRLKITKTAQAGPDFECEVDTEINGAPRTLSFYVEVKSLDIVDAPQRLKSSAAWQRDPNGSGGERLCSSCWLGCPEHERFDRRFEPVNRDHAILKLGLDDHE
jgi:hypothetical protein